MADNMEQINCPACGKEMKKVFMPVQGVHLDVCVDGCGGIYFDNREFTKFDEPHEDISPLTEVLKDREYKPANESSIRICPVCGMNMVKNFASMRREVEVDECYNCGGKFLDYGELEALRSQYFTEEERTRVFQNYFAQKINTSEFDNYQSRSTKELFGKRKARVIGFLTNKLF